MVKLTSGAEALERCAQALTVSSVAVASGVQVSLWLTGESVWLAVPGRAEQMPLEHSAPLAQLRDDVLTGGSLTVCTQCAQRRDLAQGDLLDGVRIAGAATFVLEALDEDAQVLVY